MLTNREKYWEIQKMLQIYKNARKSIKCHKISKNARKSKKMSQYIEKC